MKKSIKIATKIILFILIILTIFFGSLSYLNKPKDKNDESFKTISIEKGYSTDDIASALYKEGVISSKKSFKIISRIYRFDGKYQAGTYAISPAMRPRIIAKKIADGKVEAKIFTIPEGFSILQIADRLDKNKIVKKDDFLKAVRSKSYDKNFKFLNNAQSGDNHLEGYLYPLTYHVAINATSEQIIESMLSETSKFFTKENEEKAKKLGYNLNEIMIIASLIEREAGIDEDRGKIASVIYNRLKIDMPLQLCSSVQYAQSLAGLPHKEDLSIEDTQFDSPYNTYIHKGLPAGPVCSPGKKSIEAALNPEKTDYLYFVLSGKLDGSSEFSKDISDFEKNKESYTKAREKKN